MTAPTQRLQRLLSPTLGLSIVLALLASGCGDKAMPSQPPMTTPTPAPKQGTPTPTPTPTPGPSTVSMHVTLSRATPPANFKHAAFAAVVVRSIGGPPVQVARMTASSYYGFIELQVSGFTPFTLTAGQTKTFTVTLTTNEDISCKQGVDVTIFPAGQRQADNSVGCETADWPF